MRRWTHGHSIAAGIAGGLLLAGHTLELVTVAFVLGLGLSRFRDWAGTLAYKLSDRARTAPRRRPAASSNRGAGFGWDDAGAAWHAARAPKEETRARARARIAGVLDRVGRMLRDDEEIPF